MNRPKRVATITEAWLPIVVLTVSLFINVAVFGDASLDGSNQIILLFSGAVAALIAGRCGYSWSEIQLGITESIHSAMPSILILLLIGAVSGSWLVSGIVPAMIYYGLFLLHPAYFPLAACVVCSIVSMSTGSSWTTAATVGIALMGIGTTLGYSEGLTAGAILSGAYFGDKMSPLSDTTNLAPAMAGTDLFTHIRHMTWTTVPVIGLTLVIFAVIGLVQGNTNGDLMSAQVMEAIADSFNIHFALFLVPTVVVVLIVKKVQAVPALLVGIVLADIIAVVWQPHVLEGISGESGSKGMYIGGMKSMYGGVSILTENTIVNELLHSGGMYGMLKTVWLIICAMVFGGVMHVSGLLSRIVGLVIDRINTTGSLVASTAGSCLFFNLTASDQYLAIVVPGRMYAKVYEEKGLAPENLSRTLEDTGTVTSVLIPWNTCGAYHAGVLGVSALTFAPFCFFNLISPLMTVLFGYFNIGITHLCRSKED